MFTELSVLYAKYRPEKRESAVLLSSLPLSFTPLNLKIALASAAEKTMRSVDLRESC